MNVVSLITARGGSKGIPGKNIIQVNNRPLLWYSIDASLRSNVKETWVSTDDDEIKKVAIECGAQVIDRPQELSDDVIMPDAAILHFAQHKEFDIVVFIQPTSPMIKPRYINLGIEMVVSGEYDSSFAVVKKHWLPTWDTHVRPIGWNVDNRPRRQDMPEMYEEAGMFYITTRQKLLESQLRYSGNIGIVEIPRKDSFQIDTYEDLELIETLCRK